MEININCDLGEKSKHHSNKYDPDLLEIVNSANVACGYHAGDNESMKRDLLLLQRELLQEKTKVTALSEELENFSSINL